MQTGSEGCNVLPQEATLTLNLRYIPHQNMEESNAAIIKLAKKFDLDVQYVDNVTFLNDWKIVFGTIKTVITREGISSDTSATMEEFFGTEEDRS